MLSVFSSTLLLISPGLLIPFKGAVEDGFVTGVVPIPIPALIPPTGFTEGALYGWKLLLVMRGAGATSSPVAITVIVQVSEAFSSYIAPKIILTSSPASP